MIGGGRKIDEGDSSHEPGDALEPVEQCLGGSHESHEVVAQCQQLRDDEDGVEALHRRPPCDIGRGGSEQKRRELQAEQPPDADGSRDDESRDRRLALSAYRYGARNLPDSSWHSAERMIDPRRSHGGLEPTESERVQFSRARDRVSQSSATEASSVIQPQRLQHVRNHVLTDQFQLRW